MSTPKLSLTELVEGQAQAEISVNDNSALLDFLVGSIVASEINDPPVEPSEGTCHLVGNTPTGDWIGHEGEIAAYYSGWKYFDPPTGWRIYNAATGKFFAAYGSNLREIPTANSADIFEFEKPVEFTKKLKLSTAAGLTASTTQSAAGLLLSLDKQVHEVATVSNANDAVVLPIPEAGHVIIVANHGANTLQIFPQESAEIANLGSSNSTTLAVGKSVQFIAVGETKWLMLPGA